MSKIDPRFRKCDLCGKETNPPAAGIYHRTKDLWVCLEHRKEEISTYPH